MYEGVQDIENSIPSTIEIGENIIFVGTVNFDETTKELSDRLLDRTNLITLQKIPFCEMGMEGESRITSTFESNGGRISDKLDEK